MRFYRSIPAVFLGTVLLVLGGCGAEKGPESSGGEPPVDDILQLRLEPLPDERAEILALLLSEEIEAPLDLYERIHTDLGRIAESNRTPIQSEAFKPRHDPSQSLLTLHFFPGGRRAVQSGDSRTWDSLNAIYQPWFEWPADGSESAHVYFPGRLNVGLLGALYVQAPEVEDISMFSAFLTGGSLLAVAEGVSDTLLYAFYTEQVGPPILEPVPVAFWCYYTRNDGISYAGEYIPFGDLQPDWWPDFCSWIPVHGNDGNDLCDTEMSYTSVLLRDEPPATFRKDACETHSVTIEDRELMIAVSYSGGCRDHALNVIMTPAGFVGGPSRIANLYLRHNANGDMCEAVVQDTARVDLLPVLQLYEGLYGQLDAITLHVWDSDQDEFNEVVYDPGVGF